MDQREFWDLSGVSDEHLLRDLTAFIANGARVEASVVAHLAEVEERRLHLKAASPSLFDYCLRRLGLSESAAFHRITAARLGRRFPVIFGLLAAGSIHLSALRVLRDHLTHENHRELLAAALGKSKRQVEELVAALAPRPDVAPLLRKLPAKRRVLPPCGANSVGASLPCRGALPVAVLTPEGDAVPAAVTRFGGGAVRAGTGTQNSAVTQMIEPDSSKPVSDLALGEGGEHSRSAASRARNSAGVRALEPLSSARYLLRLSVSRETTEKLVRARDLMSHVSPSGDLAAVLERALDVLIEKLEQQRFAQSKRPRVARKWASKKPPQHAEVATVDSEPGDSPRVDGAERGERESARPSSAKEAEGRVRQVSDVARTPREHIPNEIRRAVALRDGFQCTYIDRAGERCPSRAFLQLHHDHAHALGGASTLENLRLLCGAHNRLLAEQDFGRAHQERFALVGTRARVELPRRQDRQGEKRGVQARLEPKWTEHIGDTG